MKFDTLYQKLVQNKRLVFSLRELLYLFPEEKSIYLKQSLYRWKSKGYVQALKRNLYELTYPKNESIPDYYIAQRLYSPSYISLETALSYYNLIPEVPMAITSITTKPTRRFKNEHGLFIYRSVQASVFSGYQVDKVNEFDFFIAEPEKAFVDFVYFKMIDENRFDLEAERLSPSQFKKLSRKKLKSHASLYQMNIEEVCGDYL